MDNYPFYLLSILNAESILGRAMAGPIADRVGALNLMISEASGTGPLQFSRISVNSTAGIVIFCVFYGFLSGAYVTLLGAMLAGIAPHVSKGRTWIGMNFGISSVGLLIGKSIAGALIKHRNLIPLQIFGGVMVFANCFIFCYVRYTKLRKGVVWNVKA